MSKGFSEIISHLDTAIREAGISSADLKEFHKRVFGQNAEKEAAQCQQDENTRQDAPKPEFNQIELRILLQMKLCEIQDIASRIEGKFVHTTFVYGSTLKELRKTVKKAYKELKAHEAE